MQYMDNLLTHDDYLNDELSLETPIGWSSVCFDQTINYYIEWNSTNTNETKNIEVEDNN